MTKINVVFQDCWKRGINRDWAEAQMDIAHDNDIQIEPLRYYQTEASALIREAHEKGVEMPFFTDGKKFSRYVSDFIPKATGTTKKVKE